MAAADDVPLLVRVLAGNPATAAAVLSCLNSIDASTLRRLHPAAADVVAGVPWCDMDPKVHDVVRWRAALPAAVGARLAPGCGLKGNLTAMAGVTHLSLRNYVDATDDLLIRLPASLCALDLTHCFDLTGGASLAHLTALTSLNASWTKVLEGGAGGLPLCLQELDLAGIRNLRVGTSLAHLSQLRTLRASKSVLDTATLASLPPGVVELDVALCSRLTLATSFAHLPALRTLDVSKNAIGDGTLASMPPSLVFLDASSCRGLTPAASLPHLPALTLLDVSDTAVGDTLVGSLPAGLEELRLAGCCKLTPAATLDHVRALRLLHSVGTDLASATLAACRARGCVVPATGKLAGHRSTVASLAVLSDGRLASCGKGGEVRVWNDVADEGKATAEFEERRGFAVTALPDSRLAVAVINGAEWGIVVWDLGAAPRRCATIWIRSSLSTIATLRDGRLAAGCTDGVVRVVDVEAPADDTVVAELRGHTLSLSVLLTLPGGTLTSASYDASVRLWDVDACTCVGVLAHPSPVISLAVLPDGRLASGANDGGVRLWDVDARICVGLLTHTRLAPLLAALPDGRLATASADGVIRVWDTRPAAAVTSSRAAGAAPVSVLQRLAHGVAALVPLPDGRLACADAGEERDLFTAFVYDLDDDGDGAVYLLEVPPPAAR